MNCLIFGTGSYFENRREYIKEKIIAFVDNKNEGEKELIPIIKPSEIKQYVYDYIYIMSIHFVEMGYQLLELDIPKEKIKFGINLGIKNSFEKGFISEKDGKIIITDEKKLAYQNDKVTIAFNTFDELYNIKDIYCRYMTTYNYKVFFDNREEIVIDIGMNIGAASIYFASREKVEKVYSFEPFKTTYKMAKYNIKMNDFARNKVIMKNVGLGKEDEIKEVIYNSEISCGLTTDRETTLKAINMYKEMGLVSNIELQEEQVEILSASKEIYNIISDNREKVIILKIDCEGAEYDILNELDRYNLLKYIKIIMLEWHYDSSRLLEEILIKNKYNFFNFGKNDCLGLIYAINSQ